MYLKVAEKVDLENSPYTHIQNGNYEVMDVLINYTVVTILQHIYV